MKHANFAENVDQGMIFLNVLAAQQESILERIDRVEKHREEQFQEFKTQVFDEMKDLKHTFAKSNSETSTLFQTRFDKLAEAVSSFKPINNVSKTSKSVKEKVLLVGDSLSRNLNISVIKNITDMEIRRAEAFIVDKNDPKAKIPEKNFRDIVPYLNYSFVDQTC